MKKLSWTIFFVVSVLFLATTLNAHAQTFTLTNQFAGPTATGSRAVGWKVGTDTINVKFTRRYNNSPDCETNYSVRFKFSDGFRSFHNGQKFTVEASQLGGVAPCGMKKSSVAVHGPSIPEKLQPIGWEQNYNMRINGYSRDWHGLLRLYSLQQTFMDTHMEAVVLKDVKQTAIVLDAAGNRFYLIYAIGGSSTPTLGKLSPGRYSSSDWGTIQLSKSGSQLVGTYTSTFQSGLGKLVINSDGRSGTWSEPAIGRSGRIFNIVVSSNGRIVSFNWDVVNRGQQGGTTGGSSSMSR